MIKYVKTGTKFIPWAKRPCWLYVVRAGARLSKIGSSIDPGRRLLTVLWVRNSNGKLQPMPAPEKPIVVWRRRYGNNGVKHIERALKHLLQHYAIGAEWYEIPPERAVAACEYIATKMRRPTISAATEFALHHEPWSKQNDPVIS